MSSNPAKKAAHASPAKFTRTLGSSLPQAPGAYSGRPRMLQQQGVLLCSLGDPRQRQGRLDRHTFGLQRTENIVIQSFDIPAPRALRELHDDELRSARSDVIESWLPLDHEFTLLIETRCLDPIDPNGEPHIGESFSLYVRHY